MSAAASPSPKSVDHSSYGLKPAVLSPSETLAQSVALIAPTCSPVMTVPLVFALAGDGTWLAFVIATVTIVLVAMNINQFARTSSSPGSLYSYIAAHMHPVVGMLAGWALLIAYIGTASAVAAGFAHYANVVLKDLVGVQAFPILLTALTCGVAAWLAYRDVQISARLMLFLQAGSVALISFIALGILYQHGLHFDRDQLTLNGVTPEKLRLGLVLAIFCSVGFESATSLGSEARDPLRSIPRAVKWSAILAGLFFVLCAYTEVLGFRGENETFDHSAAPLHVLAQETGLPPLAGTFTDLGAVLSFFACGLACITAGARVLFLMGRHGALHSLLGEAHETNQTPHRAVLICSLATFLPAGIMTLRGLGGFEIYGLLGTLATFGFVTAYILVSAAAPIFLRSQGRLTAQAIGVSILAVVAMCAALLGSIYPLPPAPYSVLPYVYAGLLLGGLAWSIILNARSPALASEIAAELKSGD
jgi:amino acid transporter